MIMTADLDFIYMKVYARSIDAMNGVHIVYYSCTLGHSEANEDGFYLGGDLHISYMLGGGVQDTMVAVRATGHILGIS